MLLSPNGIVSHNSAFSKIPRLRPVFWTSRSLWYFTWEPVLQPNFFHNFSEFIQDSLAMLLRPKPLAYYAAIQLSLNFPKPWPVFQTGHNLSDPTLDPVLQPK